MSKKLKAPTVLPPPQAPATPPPEVENQAKLAMAVKEINDVLTKYGFILTCPGINFVDGRVFPNIVVAIPAPPQPVPTQPTIPPIKTN